MDQLPHITRHLSNMHDRDQYQDNAKIQSSQINSINDETKDTEDIIDYDNDLSNAEIMRVMIGDPSDEIIHGTTTS